MTYLSYARIVSRIVTVIGVIVGVVFGGVRLIVLLFAASSLLAR